VIIKPDYNPALCRYFSGNDENEFPGFFDEKKVRKTSIYLK